MLPDKADKPAIVVAMSMAQHQAIEPGRIDAQQVDIAVEDFRRVTEIQKVLGAGSATLRLQVQRQPPFTGQRGHLTAADFAGVFDCHG